MNPLAAIERMMGYTDDPYARLQDDLLDDINYVLEQQGEPPVNTIPAYDYCPSCRKLRIVK